MPEETKPCCPLTNFQERAMKEGWAFMSADYTLLAPASGHDVLNDIKDLFSYLERDLVFDLLRRKCDKTVDANAIAVAGSSAGGLCAYLAGTHASPKPKAILSLYGLGGDFLVSIMFHLILSVWANIATDTTFLRQKN